MGPFDWDDVGLPHQGDITEESVKQGLALSPKRICFSTTHRNALSSASYEGDVGRFSVPFRETVGLLFAEQVGLTLFRSEYGYWRCVRSQEEYEQIQDWIKAQGQRVFLRDALALSVALSEHIQDDHRTSLGELEYQAKYKQDVKAVGQIIDICSNEIQSLPFYRDSPAVCAVTPRAGKEYDLPSQICEALSLRLGKCNISDNYFWSGSKPTLKEVDYEDKWEALEGCGLSFINGVQFKSAILVDDLCQSGVTMQYVARTLLNSGVERVYGLSLVKSRGNKDNR